MQIPQYPQLTKDVKLLVTGNVKKNWGADACAAAYLDEVKISVNWVGGKTVQIFSGSRETNNNFTVSIDGRPRRRIEDANNTVFLEDEDLSVIGSVVSEDPDLWRPDAFVVVNTEGTTVEVSQHTEGRFEESMAMLDISVTKLDQVSDTVGSWLGVDGSTMAGLAPPECAVHRPELLLNDLQEQTGSSAKFVFHRLATRHPLAKRARGGSKRAEVCLS